MNQQKEIHQAIDHLMAWADTDAWLELREDVFNEHFSDLAERLGYSFEDFMDSLIERGIADSVFTFCFEDFATQRFEPDGGNVIEDFLKRRGWREGVRGQRYLRQLLESDLSLYEVSEVVPGEYCVVTDLIYERGPQRVYEHSGTQMMAKWDRIGARILPGDGKCMFGGAVLPFSHEASERVLGVLSDSHARVLEDMEKLNDPDAEMGQLELAGPDPGIMQIAPRIFTSIWMMDMLERLDRPEPEMVTRDGDPVIIATTNFSFDEAEREEIIALLDAAPEWNREPQDGFDWVWLTPGFDDDPEAQSINGFLNLRDKQLNLTANSVRRSELAVGMLNTLLGDRVSALFTQMESPQQIMADGRDDEGESNETNLDELDIDPQELAEIMNRHMDQHYRKTLDEPVPMLGNKSPRQCVKSKAGKKKVIAWLKYLENQGGHMARNKDSAPYDFSWMWQELGLAGRVEGD